MAITSKVEICSLALSHLGNYSTVTNIDTPTNDKEITFSLWYDITRQTLLKTVMPNFAQSRIIVSQMSEAPAFGYAYFYEYPNTCLKALGIGNVADRENDYSVERCSTGLAIATDQDYEDGLELRYIYDVTDVNQMSPEFKVLLSWVLAGNVALDITQDVNKANSIMKLLPDKMSELSGLNAQENRPIRISRSRYKEARHNDWPNQTGKR